MKKESFNKYYKRVSPSKNKTAVMGMKYKGRNKPTRDNKITNRLVKQGKLPKSQAEIYKNPDSRMSHERKSDDERRRKMSLVKRGFPRLEDPEGRRRKMSLLKSVKHKGKKKPKKLTKVKKVKAKRLSVAKAKKILKDGAVRGHPLSKKQRGFFGSVAGGNSNVK